MPGNDEYRTDYPREPIGGGNPYWRCSCCGRSDPQINGRVDGHYENCEWRTKQERKAGMAPKAVETGKTPEQRANDIMDQACLSETYVNNGVDGALRRDIALAIRDAIEETRRDLEEGTSSGVLRELARQVHETFKRDLEQGYHSKDKEFAVTLLGMVFDLSGGSDTAAEGAEPVSVMGIPLDNPEWDKARGKPHDWRKYVGDNVQALWGTLTSAQRLAIALDAEHRAGLEEWE